MNVEPEDYTPSLLAGLQRYRVPVALTVALFALLGAAYAVRAWVPRATMDYVVQVASGATSGNNADPDRATSEVAAQMSSPEVVTRAEAISGTPIDDVGADWGQGESTISVLVASDSEANAKAGAEALLPAYTEIHQAQVTAALDQQLTLIDAAIADVDALLAANAGQLAGVTPNSADENRIQTERSDLNARRNQLEADKNQARLNAAAENVTVSVAGGPDGGPGQLSLLLRYVPAAIVAGLLLAMVGVAILERRRPWLADPEMAARLLHAPLLAVGPGPRGIRSGSHDVAPVVAMSVLRAVANTPTGIALVVPAGGHEAGEGAALLTRDMTPVLERAGAKVAVLVVAAGGQAYLVGAAGAHEEIRGLWSEFSGREEFEGTLRGVGIDADLLVLVPAVDIEHEVLLDLVLLADVTIVATSSGAPLEPLFALRRDFEALGRHPHGVVADLAVR